MELTTLLSELMAMQGSDLHLVVGQPPVFRVNGTLIRREGGPVLDATAMEALLLPTLSEAQQAALQTAQDIEITLRQQEAAFRYHVFYEQSNLCAAIRSIPNRVPTLDELGLTAGNVPVVASGDGALPIFHALTKQMRGLILVVGNTGSGKSTTIAAMIEEINQSRAERILTVEHPTEYLFKSKQSVITQRNVGEDVPGYPAALRAALRSDPDVVLVGELRDLESMAMVLSLADTGHLVFTVMHTDSASEAIRRIVDAFPDQQQPPIQRLLARNLSAVIVQKLLPRKGRPGRLPVHEILIATPRIRRMILEGQTDFTVAIEAGREAGMQTMDDALVRCYERGDISYEQALYNMQDKERLRPLPELSMA